MTDIDTRLKLDAYEKATRIVEDIFVASTDPARSIRGESLKAYEELKIWDWFDNWPIDDANNRNMYIKIVATELYRQMKLASDQPPRGPTKTKWEYVMGRSSSVRR
jgi:hypothetical protein